MVRVVDGDTIRVRFVSGAERPVRYIGIDTPETHRGPECLGAEATRANRDLVEGRRVRLAYDAERRDRYDRLLAYVYVRRDGSEVFVNDRLVRDGYAQPLTIPPNVRHAERFLRAAGEARRAGRGLWSKCAAGAR